jgi:hypothetical protein
MIPNIIKNSRQNGTMMATSICGLGEGTAKTDSFGGGVVVDCVGGAATGGSVG